jgi:hypothetical protein
MMHIVVDTTIDEVLDEMEKIAPAGLTDILYQRFC